MKIKCVKMECSVCHREGLAQLFLNKHNEVSYARVRHYSHIDKVSHKPQFTYCKITDLEALKTLLLKQDISLSVDRAEVGQMGQSRNAAIHDLNLKDSSSNQQDKRCRGSLAWLGRQTHNLDFQMRNLEIKGAKRSIPEVAGSKRRRSENPAPGTTQFAFNCRISSML